MNDLFSENAGAVLTIDLDAICANWGLLKTRAGAALCGAVVKADAYGLGASRVAPALFESGCRHFFVAHLDEAINLRRYLPESARLYVLHGPPPGAESELVAHKAVPVLNSSEQIAAWRALAIRRGCSLPAIIQVDTGMARLGLTVAELEAVAADPESLRGIAVLYMMSHLACAEEQENPFNEEQLGRFVSTRKHLPDCGATFANSSGIFLGERYHFNLVRPGAALYGVAPLLGAANPMRCVIRLQAKIIQVRTVNAGTTVGYGQTWRATRRSRIATVAVGYADGYLRSIGNRGLAYIDGMEVPLIGNVSMDTVTLDVSAAPESTVRTGGLVDLISREHGVDQVAASAQTIAYEILTGLGKRFARQYLSCEPAAAPLA